MMKWLGTDKIDLALKLEPNKTRLITIRVSQAEKNILQMMAKAAELNLSQFLINPHLERYQNERNMSLS